MGFLLGNWKLIAAGGVVVAAFVAGWNLAGSSWEAKWNEAVASRAAAVIEERDRLQAEFLVQRSEDTDARQQLADDLLTLRTSNERLEEELSDAVLTKTPTEVITEFRDRIVTEEVEICTAPVLANPFTVEFARLFNDSAGGGARLPGSDTEG